MEKLQEQGWFLSEQGFKLVSESDSITDIQKLIKRAVDVDLREIGSGQGDISQGNIVLQIQKLRNISAPKINEASRSAPRMLKLSLTDGKNNYQAVELESISGLSVDTPPGTKILLKRGNIMQSHGVVLLRASDVAKVLGGKVTNLVEKWELNRKLAFATHSRLRSVEEGGPPPWIPFGKKIMKGGSEADRNFKSLTNPKDPTDKETTEFEAQRQDAIAEAARLGGKKVFGGGNKQLLDHSVQKIVDQGFSVEQAEYALKISRNNVDRALKSLQRTSDNRSGGGRGEPREAREARPKRFEKKSEETKPSSGKVSLFDFLEDKLPAQNDAPEQQQQQPAQHQRANDNFGNYRVENHFERLELRGSEYSQAGRGGRAQKGGRGYQAPPRHIADDSKYSKRPSNDNYNPFASVPSFGDGHHAKPPRFQRNSHDSHGGYQQDNVFKSNHAKSFQVTNERKSGSTFGQSRGEFGSSNAEAGAASTGLNKSHRGTGRNNHHTDRSQAQVQVQADGEAKNRHAGNYEASYAKQNRSQQEAGHRNYGNANAVDKNYRNQSNRTQHFGATEERESNSHGNNGRNSNNDGATSGGGWAWKVGDDCMAKYWEDNRYYNAQVTAVSTRTCVVLFKDFNNYEEVLQLDCIPITDKPQELMLPEVEPRRGDSRSYGNRSSRYDSSENHISAGMEFRRGGGAGGGGVGGGSAGSKGYNRKRGQQRIAQPIYQPPAQRGHSTVTWTARDNPPL